MQNCMPETAKTVVLAFCFSVLFQCFVSSVRLLK